MSLSDRVAVIREKYGELLTLEDVAEIFRYKTVEAARKAHYRGGLPVKLYRFPQKAGYFARADDVAECIENMIESEPVTTCPTERGINP